MPHPLSRLRRWLGRLRDPKPLSLEQWIEKHERVVVADVARILPHVPREEAVILDVGANVGLFTAELLRHRPDARAYLFEPVPEYYELARDRFAGNPNVVVEPFGLSDHEHETTIYKARHNPGGNCVEAEFIFDQREISETADGSVFDEETIRLRVFDDYAEEEGIERVDFVKTDAEGHDYAVLSGMLEFLRRCDPKPPILAELLAEWFHIRAKEQRTVLESLFTMGYRRFDVGALEKIDDVLIVPEE